MSNIEHKDVGVSSLKGTPSRKIYIKTSTEAVYNPEGVTQEYINNHVDGSKIVDGTVTTSKIADNAVTMGKLGNEVQTLIQRGADSSWTPMGDYDVDALYYANDLVFDPETNSSYLSLRADNMGHAVTDEEWWMKVIDGSYEKEAAEIIEAAVAEVQELTAESVETIQSLVDNLPVAQVTGQSTSAVMSQKAVTDEIDNIIQGENAIDISSLSVGNGNPNSRGRCWVVDSVPRQHYILEKYPEYKKVKFTANSSLAAMIVFLKSYTTPANNAPLPLCDTPYSIRAAQAGVTQVVDIPEDCKYIIIIKSVRSTDYTPAFLSLIKSDEENDGWNGEFDARYNSLPIAVGWVGINGEVVAGDGKENYMFDVVGVDKIEITAGTNNTYYTWASATAATRWTPLAAARYEVAANTKAALSIPSGAKYLVIGKATGGSDYTPASTIFYTNKYNLYNSAVDIASQEELLGWLGGNGQWYFGGLAGSAHLAIPVVGESVTIVPNANNSYYTWASAVEGYNWTLLSGATRVAISSTTTLSIPHNAKYIIFGVRSSYQAGDDYTPQSVIFHQSLISCVSRLNALSMKTKTWRFMTYNIGHLNGGGVTDIDKRRKSSITDSDYDNKKYIGVSICNNFGNDFIGVTEYPLDFAPFTTSHSTETTREILFKKYWNSFIDLNGQVPEHIGDVNYDDYNAMFGRIPLLDLHKVAWNSELLANRFYMVGTGIIGECEVKIVLTHFGFNRPLTDTTLQDLQVAELVAAFQQEQYVIIMGDLNIPSLSVLDPFVSAGYSLANGGAFGTFNTYRKTDGFANRALDNIIVKGFDIKNVYMVDTDYSDHNPFLADLEII